MRLSVTLIESVRQYAEEVCGFTGVPYVTEEKLIKQIRGEFEPSPAMDLGREFHKAMETGKPGRFQPEAFGILRPRGTFEGKFTKRDDDVLVVGKWDHQQGNRATDFKTLMVTEKNQSPQPKDYTDSMQWRLTLWANPELVYFEYLNYRLDPRTTPIAVKFIAPGQEFTRYTDLERDCLFWIDYTKAFIRAKGLESFVADRDGDEFPEASS